MSTFKKIWEFPWSYLEPLICTVAVTLIGILLDLFQKPLSGNNFSQPVNLYLYGLFLIIIFLISIFAGKTRILQAFTSIPFIINVVGLYVFAGAIIGFLPQNISLANNNTIIRYLTHFKETWLFLIIQIFFLFILGLVICRYFFSKKLLPFKMKSLFFLLIHGGLWISLSAALFGSVDIKRINLILFKNQHVWFGTDKNQVQYDFDFSLKLLDFKIEKYPPKLALISNLTQNFIQTGEKNIFDLSQKEELENSRFKIKVKENLKLAKPVNMIFEENNETGSAPAVFIEVLNKKSQKIIEGWVSCGSFAMTPAFLKLNDKISLRMLKPENKKYISQVRLITRQGEDRVVFIEVNKPIKVNGWKLYQLNYDQRRDRWSEISVVEAVKDPWLPLVYIGIMMMITGAVIMFNLGEG